MSTIQQIKADLTFNQELSTIIDVYKGVAVSQFRHVRAQRQEFEELEKQLEDSFKLLDIENVTHPFINKAQDAPKTILVVTSDEGFTGKLNYSLMSTCLNIRKPDDEIVVIGQRGMRYLEEFNLPFNYFYVGEEIKYLQARDIADYLIDLYLTKTKAAVHVIFPRFISLGVQEIENLLLLPCRHLFDNKKDEPNKFEFEPDKNRVLDYLIRFWARRKIFDILWEARVSEWAARVVHTESSSQELTTKEKKIKFLYFKAMHELSDKNIREIFASSSKLRRR